MEVSPVSARELLVNTRSHNHDFEKKQPESSLNIPVITYSPVWRSKPVSVASKVLKFNNNNNNNDDDDNNNNNNNNNNNEEGVLKGVNFS